MSLWAIVIRDDGASITEWNSMKNEEISWNS